MRKTFYLSMVPKTFTDEEILAMFKHLKLQVNEIKEIPITKYNPKLKTVMPIDTGFKKLAITFKHTSAADRIYAEDIWSLRLKNHDMIIDPIIYPSELHRQQRQRATIKGIFQSALKETVQFTK